MTLDELKKQGYTFRVAHTASESCCTVTRKGYDYKPGQADSETKHARYAHKLLGTYFSGTRAGAVEMARQAAEVDFVKWRLSA